MIAWIGRVFKKMKQIGRARKGHWTVFQINLI